MKVIILAAGMGTRLGLNIPKSLVEIEENRTILDNQIENLIKYINIKDITLVVGYKKELLINKYKKLNCVFNPDYKETNTAKSLSIALEQGIKDDILWLNGDIVFEEGILKQVCQNSDINFICVKNEKIGKEEVGYTVDRYGNVDRISKSLSTGLGEAIGINFIKAENFSLLKSCLKKCDERDYFEKGMEIAINLGIKFRPLDISKNFCIEVDFWDDLEMAKEYFKARGI